MADYEGSPLTYPPLGLPTGSVRALLTLLILAVVIVETIRGRDIDALWDEALLIALAHYFTSRRFIGLAPELMRRLEDEGYVHREQNPLHLPRHSIRAIIVLAFAGLAWYVYQVQQVRTFSEIPGILLTVGAYLLGTLARVIFARRAGKPQPRTSRLWEDLKAVAVIGVLLATAIPYFLDRPDLVSSQVRNFTLAFVLFYFGSR